MSCAVCNGLREYPIIDRYGSELYSITCPECEGCGLSSDELEQRNQQFLDRDRYTAAMAEMRGNQARP